MSAPHWPSLLQLKGCWALHPVDLSTGATTAASFIAAASISCTIILVCIRYASVKAKQVESARGIMLQFVIVMTAEQQASMLIPHRFSAAVPADHNTSVDISLLVGSRGIFTSA